jgi:hypothetical protein
VVVQVPVASTQQLPCGGGQVLGEQVPPRVHVLPVAQLACAVTVQAPVLSTQHLPCGSGHVLGEQVPPRVHVLPEAQLACKVVVQAPLASTQQVPCGSGQGLGEQTPPAMNVPDGHGEEPSEQAPVAESQHAPLCDTAIDAPVIGMLAVTVVFSAPHVPLLYCR